METLTAPQPKVFDDLLSDTQFAELQGILRFHRLERNYKKQIIIMSPTKSKTGRKNQHIIRVLGNWVYEHDLGDVYDSSTGFKMPDESILSPDASYISFESWNKLTPEQQEGYAKICPDFLVELKSDSDDIDDLKAKMERYMGYGCRLAWLIDTDSQIVTIYRKNKIVEKIIGFNNLLSGEDVLPNFEFNLSLLK